MSVCVSRTGVWVGGLGAGQVKAQGVHSPQGGGCSGAEQVGGLGVITCEDQGLHSRDCLHVVRQVSQEHLCVKEEFQFLLPFINYLDI